MCYEDKDFSLDSFNGVKVSVRGQVGDETFGIADVYIEDGSGIERLIKLVESERGKWDGFTYSVETVKSVDDVILEEFDHRRGAALKSLFLDEYEYCHLDEDAVNERLEGIAYVTGRAPWIRSEYLALKCQVDESLVPESKRAFHRSYPSMFKHDAQLERFREIAAKSKEPEE